MANGSLCATACKDMAVIQKETYKQIDEEQLNKKIRFCISWFFLFSFSSNVSFNSLAASKKNKKTSMENWWLTRKLLDRRIEYIFKV
jgi:hypothetical protein